MKITHDSIFNLLLGQQLFVPLQQQLYMHEQSRAQFRRRLKVLTHPLQEVKGQSLPETTCAWPFQLQISKRLYFVPVKRDERSYLFSSNSSFTVLKHTSRGTSQSSSSDSPDVGRNMLRRDTFVG